MWLKIRKRNKTGQDPNILIFTLYILVITAKVILFKWGAVPYAYVHIQLCYLFNIF